MIKVTGVSKSFNQRIKAIDNISFQVPDGKVVALIGPNGSGKTTLFKLISGIYRADTGKIIIDGDNISDEPLKIKQKIGFVADNPEMFLRLTGLEYLNFVADMYQISTQQRQENIIELAKKFEMEAILTDKIISYSLGMKQKIMVMGALVHLPQVWILDEPLVGLDPKSAFTLKAMMKQHAKSGRTVFFATHILEIAEKIADEVIFIAKGRILYQGSLSELEATYPKIDSLEKIYLKMIKEE